MKPHFVLIYFSCGGDCLNSFQKVKINANGEYLQNIIAVAMADSTSYALTKNGEVYAWGYNRYGQFGQNYSDANAHYYPTKMQKVSNITQISAGYYDLMMLDADGSIWNVGYNDYSEFGLGNSSTYSLPYINLVSFIQHGQDICFLPRIFIISETIRSYKNGSKYQNTSFFEEICPQEEH